ncbi:MAG: tetratricopeptide repeat protein [Acidobacteria bacterium]|nr:tetratricopeptide repeat protein [Acidobacteriota bacterium]
MPTLSLCMIVRNEEAHLSRCLDSVRDLVDDIVVVDTGSTDRTAAIAREHGAHVYSFTWCDDFSQARNYSLEQATGDWILVLDADESIARRDHVAIRALLARDDLNAVTSVQRHYFSSGTVVGWQPGPGGYEEGAPYPGFVDVVCRRLFRNRPWLRFENRVHEEPVSTDPSRPLAQIHGRWVIHHYGKLGDQDLLHAKGEAYLRMGLRKVEDAPADPQAHYELGIQYRELERPADALECFTRATALVPGFRDTMLRIGLCQFDLGQHNKALNALRLASRTLPHMAGEVNLASGNVHCAMQDFTAAERAFRRALASHPGLSAASINLARIYVRQQRPADALACLDRALERSPGHRELRALRAQVRRTVGDHDGALADLAQLGPDRWALRLRGRILAGLRRFEEARRCLSALDQDSDAELEALRGAIALGLGDVDEAVGHLRPSLALQPTLEAAMNLVTALQARGDRQGALAAAADALRVSPDEPAALTRLAQLAGDTFRLPRRTNGPLTFFFYQPRSLAYDARTPRDRGLGGTESAIVYLADALARRGHAVRVFNACDEPRRFDGVDYARWETLPARCVSDRPDVLVSVRSWQAIGRARLAPLQIFWTGDAHDQPFLEHLADPSRRAEIDVYMLQSVWQMGTFEAHHRVPRQQIVTTKLGTAASMALPPLRPTERTPRARRLAYASTPFRGLDLLLELFPRIRAACPGAELDVCSSMQVYGIGAAEDRKQFGSIYRKARQPGVNVTGSLPQLELAARLQQARVLAYPNHYPETFCIAAMEAQAAGCAVVTSALGALPETVGDAGLCIPGDPHSAVYRRTFVDACVELLTNDDRWQALSDRALARAWTGYTWPTIAEEWDAFCRMALGMHARADAAA